MDDHPTDLPAPPQLNLAPLTPLPPELKLEILNRLTIKDLFSLASLSPTWHSYVTTEYDLLACLIRDYGRGMSYLHTAFGTLDIKVSKIKKAFVGMSVYQEDGRKEEINVARPVMDNIFIAGELKNLMDGINTSEDIIDPWDMWHQVFNLWFLHNTEWGKRQLVLLAHEGNEDDHRGYEDKREYEGYNSDDGYDWTEEEHGENEEEQYWDGEEGEGEEGYEEYNEYYDGEEDYDEDDDWTDQDVEGEGVEDQGVDGNAEEAQNDGEAMMEQPVLPLLENLRLSGDVLVVGEEEAISRAF